MPGQGSSIEINKRGLDNSKPPFLLVFASGFEPLAYRLGGGRSIQLSYANVFDSEKNLVDYKSMSEICKVFTLLITFYVNIDLSNYIHVQGG